MYIIWHPWSIGQTGGDNILSIGTWVFIAARRDASGTNANYDFRYDATDRDTLDGEANDPYADNSANLAIGGRASSSSFDLDGKMQRASFWSRRLSDAELDSLYNSGQGIGYGDL